MYRFGVLLCFLCSIVVFSQNNKQVAFRELTVAQGLSQNSVVSITQDSLGFMWFATQDGLNKYDGRVFTHYNFQFEDVTRPGFSKLGKTYTDRFGILWIISYSGKIQKYDKELDRFKALKTFKKASVIFQSKELDYLIGTFGNGVFKINNQTRDTIQLLQPKDKSIDTYSIIQFKDHQLAATSKGLLTIDNNSYNIKKISGFEDANFSSLTSTLDETLYLGSFGDGLFVKTKADDIFKQFKGFSSHVLPTNLMIQDLLVDKNQNLWVATYGRGVYLIDFKKESIQHFLANKRDPYALHYNDVLCLFKDFSGTIWLGTDGAGLSYFDEYLVKFNLLTNSQVQENVHVDVIRAIAVNNKDIWLGTSGKGLTKINVNDRAFFTLTINNSKLKSDRVMSLLFYNEDLWIGHQAEGLQKLNNTGEIKSFPETGSYTIWKIYEASPGKLWLCTRNNGLVLFDIEKGIERRFTQQNSNLTSNNIRTIEKGGQNTFWIGAENSGLFKLNTQTNLIKKIGSVLSPIKSLYFDFDTLWIGTNGDGLIRYKIATKTIATYTKEHGLPNHVIYSVLPDNKGYLWLSSNKGVSKFHIENEKITIENYSNHDGLQAFEFNTGAYFKDRNGVLYFGGVEGLNWFNPSELEFNPTEPKTVITNFEVFNKKRDLEDRLELKYNKNTVTFTFSALHFSQPDRNQYQYRLINNDNQWISSGNNNVAHYTNLPPNNYQFQVISSNYDAVWNTRPATYSFTILEPWYANNLAKIIYILLGIIFIKSLYNYLKWRWHIKNQLRFKHEETVRLKKLDDFKTKLYTNISHEFRTPLTLISGPIKKQLENPRLSNADKKDLSLVQRSSKRLLNLVNQLLDLSKLETGNLSLSVSKGDLVVFLKQLIASFKFKAEQKQIEFTYHMQPINNAWFDKDIIEKIVANLLSNAIKYTPVNGRIHFESIIKNGQIIISIINNGNTITDKELGKLFTRYYQKNKSADGVGIGLSLVKELVILSHGNIIAHTMNEDEIQFTVTLPVERSFFNTFDIVDVQKIQDVDIKYNGIDIQSNSKLNNSKNKALIHIVEDDPDIRQYIRSLFEDNYTVNDAIDGEQGIANAIKQIPDIIISDIMMPKVDGIELCNTLKLDERTSHIPIILLTAKTGDLNEIKGLKTGADDYITKPFNSEKLKVRVEKLIELRQQLQKRYSHSLELNDIETTSVDQKFLEKLKEVLKICIVNTNFSTAQLSQKMLMSRMQLHRKLKALTGLSTTQVIRNERLKIAVSLLKQSDLTISEIAYQTGFNTPSYFIKNFKDVYHCTPLEYQSSH